MDTPAKPDPVVNPWTKPFWEAAKQGKLLIQKCEDCKKVIFYPRIACPHCFSDNLAWTETSGKGTVYTYTVVTNNAPSAFLEDMPYIIAVVRLEEGVQMLTNIVECDLEEIACDMPVEVKFEKLNDDFTLPKFRPAKT
jgi:uncharacterized OB-fold protein